MKTNKILIVCILFIFCFKTILAQGGWEVVPGAPHTNERFDDVSFINDSVGFTGFGNKIYKTFNKGDTWTQVQSDKTLFFRSLEFLDDSLGYAGVLSSSGDVYGLYITKNGGKSFTHINNIFETPPKGICGLDHKGNTIIGVGLFSGPAYFILSRDRGLTWTEPEVPFAKGLVDCMIINDSTYLVSGTMVVAGKTSAMIMKTNDYGQNWRIVADNGKSLSYCWKIFINKEGFGIGSIEYDNQFFRTYDYGDNWEKVKINPAGSVKHFGGAAFLNDSIGWMGNQWEGGILETKNGGTSWEWLPFGNNINRIIVLDDNTALAVGATIYKYKAETLGTKKDIKEIPFHSYSISPNPANNKINIEIDLFTGTELRLDLVNEDGVMNELLFRDVLSLGKHNMTFDVSHIPSGVYFIWLRCNQGHRVIKTIIQH